MEPRNAVPDLEERALGLAVVSDTAQLL